jgi:protoheme IX farnesyltransferase
MWWDADIDARMSRTSKRPIPAGSVTAGEALAFGITLSVGSVLFLGVVTNWFAAGFLAFTIFFYAVVYSMWLKRSTAQNIVIGGAAGAFPPMIGYAAVTGSVNVDSFVLFLIIFLWTPPHFWALALVKSGDYAAAGVPMLPVVRGAAHTRLQILLYTIVLVPVGIAPSFMGFGGIAYFVVSTVTGAAMLALAIKIYRTGDGEGANKAAMQMFGFSILYLLLLFAIMLAEQSFGFGAGMTRALGVIFGGIA